MKRKKFIQTSAVAGLGTAILPKLAFSDIVSNKRIKIGVIGTGLRGQWVLWLAAKYPEIDIPAICDIDDDMIESALKILKDAQKPEPKVYKNVLYIIYTELIYKKNRKEYNKCTYKALEKYFFIFSFKSCKEPY